MTHQNIVILITGPSASGKSTIARKLCRDLHCADIDIETINYMIPDGFQKKADRTLDFNKWDLSGDIVGQLVLTLKNQGYGAIIHGHITSGFISALEKQVSISSRILILPSLDSVISRDKRRSAHLSMGKSMITGHYKYFQDNSFKGFINIDSTSLTIDQTVDSIKKVLDKQF